MLIIQASAHENASTKIIFRGREPSTHHSPKHGSKHGRHGIHPLKAAVLRCISSDIRDNVAFALSSVIAFPLPLGTRYHLIIIKP